MKTVNGHEIISLFESWSPTSLAVEGDPVGLEVGQLNRKISNVLVTLDTTEEVIEEAIAKNCNLIISHHPLFYRPIQSIRTDSFQGKVIEKLIKNDITLYTAHTNLDVAQGGVNDLLAEALDLESIELLEVTDEDNYRKLAVFVPSDFAQKVREALASAGAGKIDDYDSCSFSTVGEGRFQPLKGAEPFIGAVGKLETVEEVKIEVIFPRSLTSAVLNALHASHPYEVPAYDLLELLTPVTKNGIGRIGVLSEKMTLEQFSLFVKKKLSVPFVRVVGNLSTEIHKVAVLGGDGNKYIRKAKRMGADVLVTGDMYFHIAQDAERMGLSIVDPGHHIESIMKQGVSTKMNSMMKERGWNVHFIASEISTEPFRLF
ncbi:Nif3-like dinuclear metal center hexameric protein [Paenisporosarcina cavernae]|uniref:GTP cyclohydrolase 1 type 2 homolog n=1 Tax=Paenisporosarcina cavernae TaxID=2320858 RepID=A0A385YS61_9BACL|nr:Nif3-like dinuclear metal center hexameric protein [Paenisporosarcina cavernae]AYC29599.1 Nif3-like dinuclear metal center hexameric protein [Paenisporosarcina cavernae]